MNHQLSALPSKTKKKKKKKEMTAAGSEASLYPSCCCMVQHSRKCNATCGSSARTKVKFIYIWIIPQNLSLCSCCIQMHLQQLQALQKTLICSKLIHKMVNNSFSLQWLTKSTNHASPKIPGHFRKSDPEKMILNQISWDNSAALWVQLSKNFCISKTQ